MAIVYYLKEDEAQKEVLEAEDDEEKESEVDGEVEERESLNVRMKHGDDNETNKAQLEPQCLHKESSTDKKTVTRRDTTDEQTHSRVFNGCSRECAHASGLRPHYTCCCACCSALCH